MIHHSFLFFFAARRGLQDRSQYAGPPRRTWSDRPQYHCPRVPLLRATSCCFTCLGLPFPIPPPAQAKSRVGFSSPVCSRVLILIFQPFFQKDCHWSTTQSPRASLVAPGFSFYGHASCISSSHPSLAFPRLGETSFWPRLLCLLEASRLRLEEQLLGGARGALPWKRASSFVRSVSVRA